MNFWYRLFPWLWCPFFFGAELREKRRKFLRERLRPALLFDSGKPRLWVHTLSVGELQATAVLLKGLRERFPDYEPVLTVSTSSGLEMAQKKFSRLARILPSPLHCPWLLERYFKGIAPRALIIVETDIWPDIVGKAHQKGLPLILVNGALSEKAYRRLKRLPFLARLLYGPFSVLAMGSEEDYQRMQDLNPGPEVLFLGNLKYDFPPPESSKIEALRREFSFLAPPVIVCGSTHAGEEELLLQAFSRLGQGSLIICPRHPERAKEIKALAERFGFQASFRSKPLPARVLVVDTLGELWAFYGLADLAFVGGTLVPVGGHNLLEPAALKRPVLFGPYVESVAAVARELEAEGGGERVKPDPEALAMGMEKFLKDSRERGKRAFRVFLRHRGALERHLRLIARFLVPSEKLL